MVQEQQNVPIYPWPSGKTSIGHHIWPSNPENFQMQVMHMRSPLERRTISTSVLQVDNSPVLGGAQYTTAHPNPPGSTNAAVCHRSAANLTF